MNKTTTKHDEREDEEGVSPWGRVAVRLATVFVGLGGFSEDIGITEHLEVEGEIGGGGWGRQVGK